MAEFTCRVGTPTGDVRVEAHVAVDEASLRSELEHRGLHIFEITEHRAGLNIGGLRLFGGARRVPRRQFIMFNQQMVALIRAGLPLLQALDVILERIKPGPFRVYLTDIRQRVQSGSALSDAFVAQGEAFPRVYAASLSAGERSGELATVMNRYLQFSKKSEHLRTKVQSALMYPILLSCVSAIVICVLMFYVLPKFAEFYGDFDQKLPALTTFVIGLAQVLRRNWPPLAIVFVGGFVVLHSWKRTPAGRRFFDAALLRVPKLGEVVRMYNIAQFSRALATLLSGGIPLVSSLQTTATAIDNRVFAEATAEIGDAVREGRALWESIDRTRVMSDLTIELVKVGESTGQLDIMLSNVAEFYDEQVDETMTRVVALFEPLMLVAMGLIVGTLLLAMYWPIFQLSSVVE